MKKYIFPILKPIYKFLFSKHTDADKISFIFRRLIKQSKNANRPFYFIQIGACDGKTGDPFFPLVTKFNLSGILIEPVPYLFERMKAVKDISGNLALMRSYHLPATPSV
jgi:hypothetical protein